MEKGVRMFADNLLNEIPSGRKNTEAVVVRVGHASKGGWNGEIVNTTMTMTATTTMTATHSGGKLGHQETRARTHTRTRGVGMW